MESWHNDIASIQLELGIFYFTCLQIAEKHSYGFDVIVLLLNFSQGLDISF